MEKSTNTSALIRGTRTKMPERRIADLRWRVQFSQLKLTQWRTAHTDAWRKLNALHENAKAELRNLETA